MIGHNNGPPLGDIADAGGRQRLYYWRKAHKAAWRTPGIEIVRLRDRAAQRVGLGYTDYTSILLDRGRRVSAIFFQLEGTLLQMRNGMPVMDANGAFTLMPGVRRKFQQLDCMVLLVAGARVQLTAAAIKRSVSQVGETCRRCMTDHAIAPATEDGRSLGASIRELLERHKLPPSQTLFVGDTVAAELAAQTLGVARFLWAWHYFGDSLAQA